MENFMRMRAGLLALLMMVAAPVAPAMAGDRPLVVVELFTSQGCSSCPPADAFLARLAKRDDVLALALHVDYWDYIGWADTFARPEHTLRQKAYAHQAGMRTIYTPQMIIAGKDHVIGSKPMEVADYIDMYRQQPAQVSMEAVLEEGVLKVELNPASHMPLPEQLKVMLVTYIDRAEVKIRRGENAGREMVYTNIVTSMSELGEWNGRGMFRASVPVETQDSVAIFLQQAGPGKILGAIRVH